MKKANNLRILIIDDNPTIQKDFIKILTSNKSEKKKIDILKKKIFNVEEKFIVDLPKFQIDTASQGKEGVKYIRKAIKDGSAYSLAFVDIRMPPGWDGIETIKHIWKLDPNVQIVICTAYSDYTWEETIKELGMTDKLFILKKPFDTIAVRQLTVALTKKWELSQEAKIQTEQLEQRISQKSISLKKSLSMINATLESSSDGILIIDDNKISNFNKQFVKLWEVPQSIMNTSNSTILMEYLIEQLKDPKSFIKKTKEFEKYSDRIGMLLLTTKQGKTFECYSQPKKLMDKNVVRIWIFKNITKHIDLEKKLSYQSTHDPITNLPNKILLLDRLDNAIKDKKNNSIIAIIFFALNNFKLINESLNDEIGNQLLQSIAQRLNLITHKNNTLARLERDEFAIIALDLKNENEAYDVAKKYLNELESPFKIQNHEIDVSSNIGISLYPKDGKFPPELLRSADIAMYRGKKTGSKKIYFYTPELNILSQKRYEAENDLKRAIKNNEFFLVYQPQFDKEIKNMIGVEALIRWNHPEKGVLLPLSFIPLAEKSELILKIGEWVLRKSCEIIKTWHEQGYPKIQISVNVANLQFKQPNFIQTVKTILKETKLSPQYLSLEVTENVIIHSNIIGTIKNLKKMGIQIILDDFGTGNSSISHLRSIPIDRLKIDKSFIQNINKNRNDELIIIAIISLANSLNLEVLAEGVENINQLKFLEDSHCHLFQGLYFSEPLTEHQFIQFIDAYK